MASFLSLIILLGVVTIPAAAAHNITAILSTFHDYSQFNDYLTRTNLADEINSRQTITVLVLGNAATSTLSKYPLAAVKNELSLHILLDYYDPNKLLHIPNGTTLTTTLYQTTGAAPGKLGSLNITDLKDGTVVFGTGEPGSKLDSKYNKLVEKIPYNISIIEISAAINAPAVLEAPGSAGNITALLEKAGCKTFSSLIVSSGVIMEYQARIDEGLTVFAPGDEAFKVKGLPDLSKLKSAELAILLRYHALATYKPRDSLKTTKGPQPTLASGSAGKYDLKVKSAGDDVSLDTGVDTSRVSSTVLDDPPVVIFTVENVLLPEELFGKSPTPAPAPAPGSSSPHPAPAPGSSSPHSAPAPRSAAPPSGDSPAEAPGSDEAADKDAGAGAITRAATWLSAAVSTVIAVVVLC